MNTLERKKYNHLQYKKNYSDGIVPHIDPEYWKTNIYLTATKFMEIVKRYPYLKTWIDYAPEFETYNHKKKRII